MTTIIEKRVQDQDALLFICDFSPPRGSDPSLLEPARHLEADFISVAYNPGKSIRVSSPLAAHWIKENTGKEVVFTVATRDMNKLATQSLLLGADLLGLENLVVVKGDEFTEKELGRVKGVDDFRPTELVNSVKAMNQGLDYKGLKLRSPTSFCVGATIDLGHETGGEITLTHRKVESGSEYLLLQALFEPKRLKDFLAAYADRYGNDLEIPIFCGVQVMTADSLVFGDVPDWVNGDLASGRAGEDIALQVLQEFVDEGFRSIYLIPPVLRGGRRDYEAAQRVLEAARR